jgi:hypothetical protein
MPQTTTAQNACDVFVWLDNGAGALTDIRGSSTSCELSPTTNIGEFRTFGSRWLGRLACGSDMTITLDVVYTTTADEGYDILRDWWTGVNYATARSIRVQVPDNAGEQFDAEVFLQDFTLPLDPSEPGPIMVSATLLPTGNIVHSTIGS